MKKAFGPLLFITAAMFASAPVVIAGAPYESTMALVVQLTFIAYLLVRKYGGPGSDKLAAAVAIFGMFNVPFVYMSVNIWRTIHPPTTVIPRLPAGMPGPFWFSVTAFMLLCLLLLVLRTELEHRRAALDALFLEQE